MDTTLLYLGRFHRLLEPLYCRGDAPHDRDRRDTAVAVDETLHDGRGVSRRPTAHAAVRLVEDHVQREVRVLDRVPQRVPERKRDRVRMRIHPRQRVRAVVAAHEKAIPRKFRSVDEIDVARLEFRIAEWVLHRDQAIPQPIRRLLQAVPSLLIQRWVVTKPQYDSIWIRDYLEIVATPEQCLDHGRGHDRLTRSSHTGQRH